MGNKLTLKKIPFSERKSNIDDVMDNSTENDARPCAPCARYLWKESQKELKYAMVMPFSQGIQYLMKKKNCEFPRNRTNRILSIP